MFEKTSTSKEIKSFDVDRGFVSRRDDFKVANKFF